MPSVSRLIKVTVTEPGEVLRQEPHLGRIFGSKASASRAPSDMFVTTPRLRLAELNVAAAIFASERDLLRATYKGMTLLDVVILQGSTQTATQLARHRVPKRMGHGSRNWLISFMIPCLAESQKHKGLCKGSTSGRLLSGARTPGSTSKRASGRIPRTGVRGTGHRRVN